jgi:hypothetical protein
MNDVVRILVIEPHVLDHAREFYENLRRGMLEVVRLTEPALRAFDALNNRIAEVFDFPQIDLDHHDVVEPAHPWGSARWRRCWPMTELLEVDTFRAKQLTITGNVIMHLARRGGRESARRRHLAHVRRRLRP